MTETLPQCYHVYYTKDINKKKKVFKEGVLVVTANNGKLFDEDGQLVTSFKNKEKVEIDEEYVVNNSYLITVDRIGNYEDFGTGLIFTKKQITILPIKKKPMPGLSSKVAKQQDLVHLKCGLNIEPKLYEVLRPHQREGVQFMYQCVSGKKNSALSGCILADYMGLGKTLQTLALTYSMIRQKDMKKFVIVCPLTLLDVWQKQSKKWLQQKIIPLVCHGDGGETANTVKKFTTNEYRMLIISYQTFYKNIQKISGKCDMVIFDEGHRMKNKKSKLLLKLKTFKCQKRILLTGTPIQNNLQELYTCISIISPRMFGNQALFKNVFMKPILEGLNKKATLQQKQLAKQRTSQLARQLKQFSLRRSADVLKKFLPIKYEHFVFLKLTPLQNIWYQQIVDAKNEYDKDMFRTLNDLRKLFIHPSILKMSKINRGECQYLEDCSEELSYKIQFTLSIIKHCVENQEKCVIVSYYTQTLDFIGNLLKQRKVGYAKLDGRQRPEDRKNSILKFEKEIPVLLLSGKAGGTGLTLICAVKMIMIEPDWNPSNDSQVMGRIWRQGQQKQVDIFRLITASTFEEKILQRQSLKKTLSNNLIDNGDQFDNEVDYEGMGKLFIKNKGQVLTYQQKQNEIDQFMVDHPAVFTNNSGIIFVKTNNSNSSADEKAEESSIQKNEFCRIGLSNFQIKEKGQSETESEAEEMEDDFQNIEEIQKIKIPKQVKCIRIEEQRPKREKPKDSEVQTDQEENLQTKHTINHKSEQGEEIVKQMKVDRKQEQSRSVILKGENNKTQMSCIGGPSKLLNKIIKK